MIRLAASNQSPVDPTAPSSQPSTSFAWDPMPDSRLTIGKPADDDGVANVLSGRTHCLVRGRQNAVPLTRCANRDAEARAHSEARCERCPVLAFDLEPESLRERRSVGHVNARQREHELIAP